MDFTLSRSCVAWLASITLLGGCTSFSPDGGFASVQQTTRERLGQEVRWGRTDD